MTTPRPEMNDELWAVVRGQHLDPHRVLGLHEVPLADVVGDDSERGQQDADEAPAAGLPQTLSRAETSWVVRAHRPDVSKMSVVLAGEILPMQQIEDTGLWQLELDTMPGSGYRFELTYPDGNRASVGDPYRFVPTIGEFDLHLIGTGRHRHLWHALGARRIEHQGVMGTAFTVWAPNANAVRVVGDFNGWDGRIHPCRLLGASGVWELFIPLVEAGAHYKYEVITADGALKLKADPMAQATECPPANSSRVAESSFVWTDQDWIERRTRRPFDDHLSIYEVHLGSWRRVPEEDDRPLTYRELAVELADHVIELGFTHVELMPVAEHPYAPSWGYQVTGFFAPTARFGDPDDFRFLVDTLHARGIGVIVDWVPAHFPKDDWALGRFDGTALYEHADPRQGEHPDWGTYVFNYARDEVRGFLVANALFWIEEFHIDGLRVDAVASMLYLDYSREEGEWLPNEQGGRENLEAITFLQEMNAVVHSSFPGVLTMAEESTSWAGVSRPTETGGLGFTHKWNMGWMHDTLLYFAKEPIHRQWEHDQLTFGLIYVWTENFISPLSHDEVVHGKQSLLSKMPGDDWQKFANLRALYAWMWAHPGKQVLFMGAELGQWDEWQAGSSLPWHLLDFDRHRGIHDLVGELNKVQAAHPALYSADFSADGFRWLDGGDRENSVFSFVRKADDGSPDVVCVANLTPVPRPGYRLGVPGMGRWNTVLDSDAERFGGSGAGIEGADAEYEPWHGFDQSIQVDLAPLAVVWLAPEVDAPRG